MDNNFCIYTAFGISLKFGEDLLSIKTMFLVYFPAEELMNNYGWVSRSGFKMELEPILQEHVHFILLIGS